MNGNRSSLLAILAVGVLAYVQVGCAQADPTNIFNGRPPPDDTASDPASDNFVEVKFMVRGYCNAGFKIPDHQAGGWGRSDNWPKQVANSKARFPDKCYLLAQPDVLAVWGKTKGMRLVLVNTTKVAVSFQACDSRLYLIQEALDETGVWKPIESLPSSWCGNSYHHVALEPGHFWSFAALRYKGSFETKLRFRLDEPRFREDKPPLPTLHSNEFPGSINPEQFSVPQPYKPGNIMDPYLEVPPAADGK